jgi:hypothetical protein
LVEKKRIESLYSAIDIGFNSLISFLTFLYINQFYGIDILGYFGLLLSVTSFIETIQMGLYEKPAYLGFGIGYKDFKLNPLHLICFALLPLLVINQLIISGYFLSGLLFTISYVLIQNIRVDDYINHQIRNVSIRSFIIFFLTFSMYVIIYFSNLEVSLTTILYLISIFRFLFIFKERNKIFSIKNAKLINKEVGLLATSLLTLVRSRLPLWSLLPFGLGLVGIYEVFRTLLELYLIPSRPIFLVMIKNLKRDGPKRTFQFGMVFTILTLLLISLTFYLITSSRYFGFEEISNVSALIAILLIALFFWMSEISGMIFQSNKFITFEAVRRASSIGVFVVSLLVLLDYLNFSRFLYLIAMMYFVECLISISNKNKLKI